MCIYIINTGNPSVCVSVCVSVTDLLIDRRTGWFPSYFVKAISSRRHTLEWCHGKLTHRDVAFLNGSVHAVSMMKLILCGMVCHGVKPYCCGSDWGRPNADLTSLWPMYMYLYNYEIWMIHIILGVAPSRGLGKYASIQLNIHWYI